MTRKLAGLVGLTGLLAAFCAVDVVAQDIDIIGEFSKLKAESAELQKVKSQLDNKREELKKEAEVVKQEEQKVEDMKAHDKAETGPSDDDGPFYIHIHRPDYSGGDGVNRGHFPDKHDMEVKNSAELKRILVNYRTKTKPTLGMFSQGSHYQVRDKNGRILGNEDTMFGGSGASVPPRPRPPGDLKEAEKGLAARKAAYERNSQSYQAQKAGYERKLADYAQAVQRFQQSLPQAMAQIGQPVPSPDDLSAPPGDFQAQVQTIDAQFKGKPVGDGSAEEFVKEVAKLPELKDWAKGDKVQGSKIAPGTPIATFDPSSIFKPGKGSSAAIYITQNQKGVWVYDQYKTASGQQRPVEARFIPFRSGKATSPANDASAYSVIRSGKRTIGPGKKTPRK